MKVVSYSKNISKQNELGYPSQKFGEIPLPAKVQDGRKKTLQHTSGTCTCNKMWKQMLPSMCASPGNKAKIVPQKTNSKKSKMAAKYHKIYVFGLCKMYTNFILITKT
jgi:hypothetical protein